MKSFGDIPVVSTLSPCSAIIPLPFSTIAPYAFKKPIVNESGLSLPLTQRAIQEYRLGISTSRLLIMVGSAYGLNDYCRTGELCLLLDKAFNDIRPSPVPKTIVSLTQVGILHLPDNFAKEENALVFITPAGRREVEAVTKQFLKENPEFDLLKILMDSPKKMGRKPANIVPVITGKVTTPCSTDKQIVEQKLLISRLTEQIAKIPSLEADKLRAEANFNRLSPNAQKDYSPEKEAREQARGCLKDALRAKNALKAAQSKLEELQRQNCN